MDQFDQPRKSSPLGRLNSFLFRNQSSHRSWRHWGWPSVHLQARRGNCLTCWRQNEEIGFRWNKQLCFSGLRNTRYTFAWKPRPIPYIWQSAISILELARAWSGHLFTSKIMQSYLPNSEHVSHRHIQQPCIRYRKNHVICPTELPSHAHPIQCHGQRSSADSCRNVVHKTILSKTFPNWSPYGPHPLSSSVYYIWIYATGAPVGTSAVWIRHWEQCKRP